MIIGSGMGGLLIAEWLGTLEVLRFIIFYELDLCYFYCKGAVILFFGELLTTDYGSE